MAKRVQSSISWGFVVIFLVCRVCEGSGIYVCSQERTQLPMVMEGQPAEMCCDILDFCGPNKSISVNDTLTLLPKNMSEPSVDDNYDNQTDTSGKTAVQLFQTQRLDACHVKLFVKDPPLEGLALVCRLNGQPVAKAHLHVIPNPPIPKIRKVISTPDKNITVVIDRGSSGALYSDNYTVTMIEHLVPSASKERTVQLCSLQSTPKKIPLGLVCPDGDHLCVCEYQEKNLTYDRVRDINVTLVVTVERIFGHVESNRTLNLIDYIQPESPSISAIEKESPHEVTVRICQQLFTQSLAYFMNLRGHPLKYHIALNKMDGVEEVVTAEFNAHVILPCVKVNFSNLATYTRYNVTTFSIGQWEGQPVSKEFTTGKSVPIQPPVFEKFAFSRDPEQNAVFLIWQHLPQEHRGGADVMYDLEVRSLSGLEVNISGIETNYWSTKQPLPQGSLWARVWARNKIGRSKNFSSIEIADLSDMRPLPFQIEISENKVQVHLKSAVSPGRGQLALHLCKTYSRQGDFDFCTSYPQTIILSPEDAVDHASGASVVYTFYLDTAIEPRRTTRQSPLLYRFEGRGESEHHGTDKTKTALEMVKTVERSEPRWVNVEPEAFLDAESDETEADSTDNSGDGIMADNLEREEDAPQSVKHKETITKRSVKLQNSFTVSRDRRKRSNAEGVRLNKQDGGEGIGTLLAGRRLLALSNESFSINIDSDTTELPSLSTNSPESSEPAGFYRVFVSEQTDYERWLGMVPAECYYLEKSENVELIISQDTDSVSDSSNDESSPIIRWRQECNNRPTQFLVDTYQVFVTSDEACKQNVSHVQEVKNRVFEPLKLEVPADWPFVCVKAYHGSSAASDPGSFVSQPFVTGIARSMAGTEVSKDNHTTLILAIVLPSTFVVIVCCFCIKCCRSGYSKVKKNESEFNLMIDGGVDEGKKNGGTRGKTPDLTKEQKWRSQKSGLATENSDSGHGTLLDQVSNGGSDKSKSKLDLKVSGDSQTLPLYHIQGKEDPHRSRSGVPSVWSVSNRETLNGSSGEDSGCRIVHGHNATSNGAGWLDESSNATDSDESSDPSFCAMERQVEEVTSDGAGWLDDTSGLDNNCFDHSGSGGRKSELESDFDENQTNGPFIGGFTQLSSFESRNDSQCEINAQSSGQSSGIENDCFDFVRDPSLFHSRAHMDNNLIVMISEQGSVQDSDTGNSRL